MRLAYTPCGRDRLDGTYLTLQLANLHGAQELPGLVTVADVLEGLRSVLARNVKQDLLATAEDRVTMLAEAGSG